MYAEELSRMAEQCRRSGTSFTGKVMMMLSGILGPSVASAIVYHVGGESLSDPRLLVESLESLFHEATEVILRALVSDESQPDLESPIDYNAQPHV